MRKADDADALLREVRREVPDPTRGHSDALLAATKLAAPFARLRANQARMEAVRAEFRSSGDEAAVARATATADAAGQRVAELDGQMARLRVIQPETCANSVSVYGYVRNGAKPLAGVTVALADGEEILARIKSAADGAFALSVCTETALGVRVLRGAKSLWRDRLPLHAPGPVAAYRIIDIADAAAARAEQDPPRGDCPSPRQDPAPVTEPAPTKDEQPAPPIRATTPATSAPAKSPSASARRPRAPAKPRGKG